MLHRLTSLSLSLALAALLSPALMAGDPTTPNTAPAPTPFPAPAPAPVQAPAPAPTAAAKPAPVSGKLESYQDHKLTLKVGKEEKTFTLTDTTPVKIDGKDGKASEIPTGDKVSVTVDANGTVTGVKATKAEEHHKKKKKD